VLATHKELAKKLAALERRIDSQDKTIVAIVQSIRQLMTLPGPKRRPIGFVTPKEKQRLQTQRPARELGGGGGI
jgi:hypothetical protein